MKDLKTPLRERKQNHLYRSRRISESPQQAQMLIDGKKVINFCSNDYLGLANHPNVKQAFIDGINQFGVGSGSAHLVNGHSSAHHQLEEALAEFTGYPRALLFSTGYMANVGLCQALLSKGDTVLEDKLNHASLIDGGLISGARFMRYPHNDIKMLASKLQSRDSGEKLVLSDGVFSMDGDLANAPELINSAKTYDSHLMIDDAHGFGVLGKNGKGILEHYGCTEQPIYMATLGKALGTAGAFIAGSHDLIETLIQQARTYIYTTAQPPAIACATLESLKLITNEPQHRENLKANIQYLKQCIANTNLQLLDSETAIQPIIIGDVEKTVTISSQLLEDGIHVTAIRPPTVPVGTARLRITLSALHTHQQIDQLISSLIRYI